MHTPGPWYCANGTIYTPTTRSLVKTLYDCLVARAASPFDSGAVATTQEQDDNARLIAAAPDLLEALKLAREYVTGFPHLRIIDAAIAKAEGS
jgi:hypothetical protein